MAKSLNPAMARRIEIWPVDRLQPYQRNARTHSDEQVSQIAASIAEFGFTSPILVDSADGVCATLRAHGFASPNCVSEVGNTTHLCYLTQHVAIPNAACGVILQGVWVGACRKYQQNPDFCYIGQLPADRTPTRNPLLRHLWLRSAYGR